MQESGIRNRELWLKTNYFLALIACSVFLLYSLFLIHNSVLAEHCGEKDYDCQIAEIQQQVDALKPAHETNKQELANLQKQATNIKAQINATSQKLDVLENDIADGEEKRILHEELLNEKAWHHYVTIRQYDPVLPFLLSNSASDLMRQLSIRRKIINEDKETIIQLAEEITRLRTDKETLEKARVSLEAAKKGLDAKVGFLAGEVEKVEKALAELSAKQQEILAAKSGSFTASVGDSELADDYYASIKGFREAAPSGSFAVFSFGGYTHRKGMSQYGARGRAENGQNYRQILQSYYGKEPASKDTGGTISVSGYGNLDFESTYLYGIAEMPSKWHAEALKAQAIAARTYAYRYKVQGSSICTTEACQVFNKGKSDNPPAAWKQAVNDTRGQVLEDVVTFYSSTSGGYLTTMGWDTTDGAGGSSFIDRAWEAKGGSPWLYKAWYRQGYSASGATCGRGNPWLSSTELADIVNAALVLKNKDDDRIVPVTTSCWGGNPYSHDELKNAANPYSGISSVSSVSVLQGNGTTNEVVINGNIRLTGSEFRQAFNVRAPGYLRIPQSGFAFFNIEQK